MKSRTIAKIVNGEYINCDENPSDDSSFMEMLKNRKFPGVRTDAQFLANHGTLDKQFSGDDRQLETITEKAKKYGYNPNPNDTYIPSLARYTGDPLAFVPAGS